MTSQASLESSLKAIRLGAYDYLLKPFEELEYVEMVVRRALDKQALKSENQRLLTHLQQKNEELVKATQRAAHILAETGTFYKAGHDILESADRDDLSQRLFGTLGRLSKGRPVVLWFYDPAQKSLVFQKRIGTGTLSAPNLPLSDGMEYPAQFAAWLSGRQYQKALVSWLKGSGIASLVDRPLVYHGKGYGLILLLNCRAEEWPVYENQFLNQAALLAAVMLQRFHLLDPASRDRSESLERSASGEGRIFLRDSITPLYSFDYFLEYLKLELAQSRRYRHKFSLFLTLPGLRGDPEKDPRLRDRLRRWAECCLERIRTTDFATRHGDKIFILLPETDREGAKKLFRELTQRMNALMRDDPGAGGEGAGRLAAVEYPKQGDTVEGLIAALETELSGEA